jgi:hypothetical protein
VLREAWCDRRRPSLISGLGTPFGGIELRNVNHIACPPDFFATIYQALGIDPKTENYGGVRPIPLAPFGSNVVKDVLV